MFEQITLGTQYTWNDRVIEVDGVLTASRISVRDIVTGERLEVPTAEIRPVAKTRDPQPLNTIKQGDWDMAKQKTMVLTPLLATNSVTAKDLDDAAKVLGKSRRQIQRYLKRFRLRQQISGLLHGRRGRPVGMRLLSTLTERIVSHCITKYYLVPERCSVNFVIERVGVMCRRVGLVPPAGNTIRRRIRRLGEFDVVKAREGGKAARHKFKPVPGSLTVPGPLELIQIDHTLVDIFLVTDDEHRLPLGRPFLTVAIDVYSRCILGIHLSLDAPSALSVALCIAHSILPKEPWLKQLGVDVSWTMYGRPKIIHTDNAAEFWGTAMARGCEELGIIIQHRPVGLPNWGGHIERYIGTLMKQVHTLPGTTFSNTREKGEVYDSEKKAAMTMAEFQRWLIHEIATRYHLTVHRNLGRTPASMWEEGMKKCGSGVQETVPDPLEVLVMFLPAKSRKIRRDGIEVFGLRYWNEDLAPLVGAKDALVYFDTRDISRVYLRAEDGRVREARVMLPGFRPISLTEYLATKKHMRELARDPAALAMRDAGITAADEIVVASKKATRSARIKQAKESERQVGVKRTAAIMPTTTPPIPEPIEAFEPWKPLQQLPVEHLN